jgi:protein SCO1/2
MEAASPQPRARRSLALTIGGLLILATLGFAAWLAGLVRPDARGGPLPVLGQVADFRLTNQAGQVVTRADLLGRVWVADIIFTRCAGPCPEMTRRMKMLQDALAPRSQARLVTLTTDPAFDEPTVLRAYGNRFGADFGRWLFLTGSKAEIARLAVEGLKLTAVEKQPPDQATPEDLFIHSTTFVLVDKQARLRAVFETVGEEVRFDRVRARILAAVAQLEREP